MSKGYTVSDNRGKPIVIIGDGDSYVRIMVDTEGARGWGQHDMCADDAYFLAWKILGIIKLIRQREKNKKNAKEKTP